jgi:DNA repair protein SbcC/Rad50
MRILSVEMRGFGPFKGAQAVDFTAFDDSGIFLIGGRTGAGKSTILDAICFALYGSVPRYDGYSGAMRLRSDHCAIDDVTDVTLTFEVDDEIYRIVRNPDYERPKSRGTGVTRQSAGVELSIQTDHGWEGLETKIPEVARRIAEIVKLDRGQFLQVILLAQNRFQEFLEAESKDRQSLLRTLFDTQRFEDYAEALRVHAQELGGDLSRLTADAVRTVADLTSELKVEPPAIDDDRVSWAERRVASAVGALGAAQAAEAHAVKVAQAATEALTGTQRLADRQRRRREAEEQLGKLDAQADAQARTKQGYEAAAHAAEVRPRLEAADQASRQLKAARDHEAQARDLAGVLPESDLSAFVKGVGHTIGSLAQALEAERKLAELERTEADALATLVGHDETTAKIAGKRSSLQQELGELAASESTATATASDLQVAEAIIASIEKACAAAVRLSEIELRVSALKQGELQALQTRIAADREVGRLLAMQLHGRAALLAGSLVDGEPCAVCGSLDHPQPARFDGEPVSDAQVTEARTAFQTAAEAADTASRALTAAEAAAAEQRGVAGGRTVAELELELEAARARSKAAGAAQASLGGFANRRAEIGEQLQQLDNEERTAGARRAQIGQDVALATKALSDAQDLIARSRDKHESVTARVATLKEKQAALERLITARSSLTDAESRSAAATSALNAQLAECGFSDRGSAQAAMLAPDTLAALAQAIRAYEDSVTQTRAVLDQPDLQHLPEEPADVAEAAARATEADAVRVTRTEWRVLLDSRARRAQELTAKLKGELGRSADLQAEFDVIDQLAKATRGESPNQLGIPLESFVLAAELEEIVGAANARLRTMSQGRYAIEHSDERTRGGKRTGLEIVVYDAHTGATRSPRSLSGGEKFLASLALALGMAEVVTNRAGGIRLDTLFIDEGFGALDSETLELAMQTLDELRQGGRTVGLISHVEAMKDQIPAKLLVGVVDGGWSVIDQST